MANWSYDLVSVFLYKLTLKMSEIINTNKKYMYNTSVVLHIYRLGNKDMKYLHNLYC